MRINALQAFGEEALQQGAIAVTPSVDPVTDNAGATQALFESPGIAYYINDRSVSAGVLPQTAHCKP